MAAMIGRDKFAILRPGSDLPSAAVFAERLRKLIAEAKPTIASQPVAITVNIGVSAINATDSTNDQAFARANLARQRARATGRKQIEVVRTNSSRYCVSAQLARLAFLGKCSTDTRQSFIAHD